MGIWTNAFKLPDHPDVTAGEKAYLSGLANKVRGRKMEFTTALAMESTKPLHNLGAQALIFLTPILSELFGRAESERIIKLLENPKAVDFFLQELNGTSNGANHVKKRP